MQLLDSDRLEEILSRAPGVRVVVVGDLMLDVYLTGPVTRISPEAPVPVVQVQEERFALGGAANVVANVVALGAHCDVVGFVGRDEGGDAIRTALDGLDGGSVRPLLVERADRPTTTKTRVMARNQQVVRFDRERDDDLPDDCAAELCERLEASLADASVVILEDYNKGVLTPLVIRTALQMAEARGVPVVVDPKFRHIFDYRGATVLKPNAFEITAALGTSVQAHDDAWLEEARRRFGCDHLLVTLGEEGMALCSGDEPPFRVPAVAREVFDVSGAGDTVIACLAVAMAAGATVREATVLANYAAAVEVTKPGVATVSPDELREMVSAAERTHLEREGREAWES